MPRPDDPASIPLTASEFQILLALVDGDKHGYAIMQEVTGRDNGSVHLGPGTLYGAIKRMLVAGLIDEADERPDALLDDQRRRYYHLTTLGKHAAKTEAERLAALLRVAQRKKLLSRSAMLGLSGG